MVGKPLPGGHDPKILEVPEPWNICHGELLRVEPALKRSMLKAEKSEGKPSKPYDIGHDETGFVVGLAGFLSLVQFFLNHAPYFSMLEWQCIFCWNGNYILCQCTLEVCNLLFHFTGGYNSETGQVSEETLDF